MADTEVENVLREIRERVRAEAEASALPSHVASAANGHGEAHAPRASGESASGALARLEANLSTTERTWSRLPPLLSNRTGWLARFELWLKRLIKRALHWFTWEQVNFNSATHHALRDAAAALAAQDQRLSQHDKQLAEARAETETLRTELAALRRADSELRSLLESQLPAALEARLQSEVAHFHEALAAAVAQLRAEEQSLADNLVQLRDEQRARADSADAAREERVAELRRELDERARHLGEELRVCFRQLSLEAGETAVAHDRARRQLETRLDAIEKVMRTED